MQINLVGENLAQENFAMSMFPVRVVVESVRPQHCLTCSREGHMLADSYAIVSGATLLSQLVDTVLGALGMPQLALHSKGKSYDFIIILRHFYNIIFILCKECHKNIRILNLKKSVREK